jgi:hypothetical protein
MDLRIKREMDADRNRDFLLSLIAFMFLAAVQAVERRLGMHGKNGAKISRRHRATGSRESETSSVLTKQWPGLYR